MEYIVGTTEMFIGNKMAKSEAEKCYLVTNTGKLQAGHLQNLLMKHWYNQGFHV